MRIELDCEEVLDREVKNGGHSARVFLPLRLLGKKIKIIVLKDED